MKMQYTLARPATSRVFGKVLLMTALSFAFLTGCATPTFNVTSEPPQADVFYQVPGSPEKKIIGKTPLVLPMSELNSLLGSEITSGEYFPVMVEKPGFLTQTFQIPRTRFATYVTALDVKMKEGNMPREERSAKTLIEQLFLAQRFALTQQFERSQIEIDKILADFPGFARALSMRASIYYAQGNMPEALKYYEEALKSDPQMDDAVKMSAKIRAAQGLPPRTPANATTTSQAPAPAAAPGTAPADNKGTAQ